MSIEDIRRLTFNPSSYNGETTKLVVVFQGRKIREIMVPFSEEEIGVLRIMREVKDQLAGEAMRASGIERDCGTAVRQLND